MFVILYRWRIKTGEEEDFDRAWSVVTKFYLDNFDSLGSRLHKGSDGLWYGYAQWKSMEHRDEAFAKREQLLEDSPLVLAPKMMNESVEESFPEVRYEVVSDFAPVAEGV